MRRFVVNLFIFGLLIILGLAGIECVSRNSPNLYSEKSRYIQHHGKDIETLFMGSSVTFWGVSPAVWTLDDAFNVAFNSHDISMNYHIFKASIDKMPHLKRVILEMSYFSLFDCPADKDYNPRWIFLGTDFGTDKYSLFSRYGLQIFYPDEVRTKLLPWVISPIVADSLGHSMMPVLAVRKPDWKENTLIATVQTASDWRWLETNYREYAALLDLCRLHSVEVILYIPPVSRRFLDFVSEAQEKEMLRRVEMLRQQYGAAVINLFRDTTFTDNDFADLMHLNTDVGAAHLTMKLQECVEQLEKNDIDIK